MIPDEIRNRIPAGEIRFSSSRSGGPGGQNVNKVNTKVEARFNILKSDVFSEEEKAMILKALHGKINSAGELIIISQSERSQFLNRIKAEEKLFKVLAGALTKKRPRKKTSPTRNSIESRLKKKSVHGTLKKLRRLNKYGDDE